MARKDYWTKREEEHQKKRIRDEKAYNAEIRKIYENMADIATKEINGFYSRYATKEGITLAEAKRRISTADIAEYAKKAEKYVPAKDMSDKANEEMRLYNAMMSINRLEMLKSSIGLGMVEGFGELDKAMQEHLTEAAEAEFVRQAGILGGTVGDTRAAARTIVNSSFHNATFSQRIWMHQDMLRSELDKVLQEGLIKGESSLKLARHISKVFGASQKDAERLMRTEMSRVYTEAQQESYDAAGFEDYTYIALGDACEICAPLDGKHFKVKQMRVGENAPPMHPNCRCSTAPYSNRDVFEKWLDYNDSDVKEVIENNHLTDVGTQAIIKGARSTGPGEKVFFDENNSYRVELPGYPEEINAAVSEAAKTVAKLGSETGWEHAILIDLETGEPSLPTTDKLPGSVRPDYSFAIKHKNVAFIHNHNRATELSFPDIGEVANNNEINAIIAMRNDGIATAVISNGHKTHEYLPLHYQDTGDQARIKTELSEAGNDDPNALELHLRDLAIQQFCEGGIIRNG